MTARIRKAPSMARPIMILGDLGSWNFRARPGGGRARAAPAGWPGPVSAGYAPGTPVTGRPAPGRPASGRPAPGRPAPGRPVPVDMSGLLPGTRVKEHVYEVRGQVR